MEDGDKIHSTFNLGHRTTSAGLANRCNAVMVSLKIAADIAVVLHRSFNRRLPFCSNSGSHAIPAFASDDAAHGGFLDGVSFIVQPPSKLRPVFGWIVRVGIT